MDAYVQKHATMQPECIDFVTAVKDPVARNDSIRAAVAHFAARATRGFARLTAIKLVAFWRPWVYSQSLPMRIASLLSVGTVLLASLLLAFYRRHLFYLLAPIAVVCVYLSIVHSIGFSYIRYRLPIEALLCTSAGYAISLLVASPRAGALLRFERLNAKSPDVGRREIQNLEPVVPDGF
jgi:hypothetical protein